jgi:hypothetical protein
VDLSDTEPVIQRILYLKMSRFNKRILFSALMLGFLVSCESEIDIDLPPPETLVVVDATIENGQYARVAVTKTAPYFDTISVATLAGIFINNAVVYLSDGVITDTLTLTIDPTQFPPIFYKGNNPALIGQEWKRYYLTVIALGDTLTATTSIPGIVPVDSLSWEPFGNNDSLGLGYVYFKEPDSLGNLYQLMAKRQGYPYFVPIPGQSISNDQMANGQYISFTVPRPRATPAWFNTATGDSTNQEGGVLFRRGDTISVKLNSIDFDSYEFLKTYNTAANSFGNPFSAPTFVKGNIKGGLGGFVGIGASYQTYVVP